MSGMISATVTVCAGALICSLLSAFVPEGTTKKNSCPCDWRFYGLLSYFSRNKGNIFN